MSKLSDYNKFLYGKTNEAVLDTIEEKTINQYIDDAYSHYKETGELVNTKDIMSHVEHSIGKELDDDDYAELYYKITGDEFDGDEIEDLDDEEKFIIK